MNQNHSRIQIDYLDPASLVPNPWNTNYVAPAALEKLRQSVHRFDMFKPILVRTMDDGALQILGGEHRARISAEEGVPEVPVINLGAMTDVRAKEIGLVDNGRYGMDDTLALSDLLKDMGKEIDHDELAGFLPYSDNEFDSIFSSTDIDLSSLEMDDDEEEQAQTEAAAPAVQTHQMLRFKVPIADAHTITDLIDKTIKTQKYKDADSLVNAGDALVHLVSRGPK